jgi:50S ribosomal subunit-associated GTPase HflX
VKLKCPAGEQCRLRRSKGEQMTDADRRSLRDQIAELRAELRREIGDIRQRLEALEKPKPKIAKVIVDPWSQSGAGGAP